jgi:hypothetical protein
MYTSSNNAVVGVGTILQDAPFHRKIVPDPPTAHPAVALTIWIAQSVVLVGMDTVLQDAPFQWIMVF